MVSKFNLSGFHQFLIVLYKGLLLRKRHYIVTAFEVIFPIFVASIPAIFVSELGIQGGNYVPDSDSKNESYPFDPFTQSPNSFGTPADVHFLFAYAPSNKHTDMLMNNSIAFWKSKHLNLTYRTISFKTEEELENHCIAELHANTDIIIFGTVFNNIPSNQENLPSSLDYKIRYGSYYGIDFKTNLKYSFSFDKYSYNVYVNETYFISWQAAVEKTFIQEKMAEKKINLDYELWMREFPYLELKTEAGGFDLLFSLLTLFGYGFLFFIVYLIQRVIEEKSNGSKELLKMMGMTNWIYWTSTFANYFLLGTFVVLIITIIYKSPLKNSVILLQNSDFFLIFFFFMLFIASLVLFCLAVSTFFNRAIFGIIVLIIAYNLCFSLLSNIIFTSNIEISYYPLSLLAKLSIVLLPPGALLTFFKMLTLKTSSGEGVTWSNLYSYDTIPDLNVSMIFLAMLFSCILYSIIIWYVDAVWPWQYGVPKPFYFPFTKSYWCGYEENESNEILLGEEGSIKSAEFFEDEPSGISPGVVIKNLSKEFRTGFQHKVAVNNISLNIYNSQITALLGHNGAGKTTTINILTGLYSPTSGSATINGWDIFKQTAKARQSLGVCPQHNVLYDTLTVEEHLKIYAALKGVRWSELSDEALRILNMLNLTAKRSEITKNLSGGMKRKLSLGIAIIGGSKVLFLDEPTSGMDAEARRTVWNTLLDVRHDRTIILTTHYMEEADILGDRIAIMADGEIQCCGSPLFLKKKFGTGYHLHLVKENNFDLTAVSTILTKHVPSAAVENEYEREITFSLMSSIRSSFGPLFEELENKKEELGFASCGITITTMEDVFLNVTSISELKHKPEGSNIDDEAVETEMKNIYTESSAFKMSPNPANQFFGLLMKRIHFAKRHWSIIVSQLVIPFLIMCFLFSTISSTASKYSVTYSALNLNIKEVYGNTDSFLQSNYSSETKEISNLYKDVLQNKGSRVQNVEDPEKYILNYNQESFANYLKLLIVGGSVETSAGKLHLTAWFNHLPYHSAPISLLLIDNAILNYVVKSGSITLTNHPLPKSEIFFYIDNSYAKERVLGNIFVPLALSFLSASFVLVPIQERISKAKLLQMMTGISATMYWLSMFLFDFIISIIICVLLIIPFAIFSHYAFFAPHSEAIGTAILLMIVYSAASIPFSYLFTLVIKKPNTGFSVINAICVIAGVTCSIIVLLARSFQESLTLNVFAWILKLIPAYALSSGFANLFGIAYSNALCDTFTPKDIKLLCRPDTPPTNALYKCCKDLCASNCTVEIYPINLKEDGCARDLILLFVDGIIYFLLLLLLEYPIVKAFVHRQCNNLINKIRKRVVNQFVDTSFTEDPDVLREEERVRNNYDQLLLSEALVVINLTKYFKNIDAVNHLTFGIHKTECFGLLGVNGAGKTTTFRMLTGDCYPTTGNAHIQKYSVITDLKKFQSHIGYCPQFDALIGRLTGEEMITLFARLRGLSGEYLARSVSALIKMTDLTQFADKQSMTYSGGNKRKLSIALALIGAPSLLLLDEPTAGVDPVSRRKIWKILSLARIHSGAAVILTTHSMEESEALCSRLAIMVNGRFRCMGSIQELKSKFGHGYTLIIKMKQEEQSIPQAVNAIKAYIDSNLTDVQLRDEHQGMLQYHVVDPTMTLSYLFKFMDETKEKYNLEDYVISDTSLEQIFLTFARTQRVVAS